MQSSQGLCPTKVGLLPGPRGCVLGAVLQWELWGPQKMFTLGSLNEIWLLPKLSPDWSSAPVGCCRSTLAKNKLKDSGSVWIRLDFFENLQV